MVKKYSMFQNGIVLAHSNGKTIPATSEEVAKHLASYLPATYKNEKLSEVKYNSKDGCVYGKYATKQVKKQVFALRTEDYEKKYEEDDEINLYEGNIDDVDPNGYGREDLSRIIQTIDERPKDEEEKEDYYKNKDKHIDEEGNDSTLGVSKKLTEEEFNTALLNLMRYKSGDGQEDNSPPSEDEQEFITSRYLESKNPTYKDIERIVKEFDLSLPTSEKEMTSEEQQIVWWKEDIQSLKKDLTDPKKNARMKQIIMEEIKEKEALIKNLEGSSTPTEAEESPTGADKIPSTENINKKTTPTPTGDIRNRLDKLRKRRNSGPGDANKMSNFKYRITKTSSKDQLQPTDGIQESKDVKVPRNESKSKPESNAAQDRPDVKNPKSVSVPRSESNGGIKGGEKVKFDTENAKVTSGNPDTYVQKFTESETPSAAGSEKNHTAGTEIQFRSEAEIYQNLKLAKENKKPKPHWFEEKGKTGKPTTPDKTEENFDKKGKEKEAGDYKSLYTEAKTELQQKTAEISKMKLREARMGAAIKYALALLNVNPAKYANAESFTKVVEESATKMTVEALNEAVEGLMAVQKEANALRNIKEASLNDDNNDGGLATALVIQGDNAISQVANSKLSELKDIFNSGTSLGRQMRQYEQDDIKN